MRPTDENQSTSMRPNLMSPRRTLASGEDSILAMLEREPARKRAQRPSGARLAWYGAGATVALALTGTLVWMAANNDGLRPGVEETVLAEAAAAGASAAPAHPAGAATVLQVAMAPEAPPAGAAVVVDGAPPGEAIPPLRLLQPAPEKTAAKRAAPEPAMAPARAAARTGPPPRPALAPAKPRPVVKTAAKALQPKAQRGAQPPRAPEAPVDADVALISAVIVHANGHAPEGSQMTELLCPNGACQARPPSQ